MFKYARTKEFEVTIQPGDSLSESIPVKGATKVIIDKFNLNSSFTSSTAILIRGSYDDVTYRSVYVNVGLGTYRSTLLYMTTSGNKYVYNATNQSCGFNYIKLELYGNSATATATFNVMVVS